MSDDGLKVTVPYTVGALIRRRFRAHIDAYGMSCREYKGVLDSHFVVTGTRAQHLALKNSMVGYAL